MNTATGTGFRRITVATPDRRVDLALPEDVPLADLHPDLLRLTGAGTAPGAPAGHHLARCDGSLLDPTRGLAAQAVHDGAVLTLAPFADSLPPPVHDDPCEALAATTRLHASPPRPDPRRTPLTAAAALVVLLAVLLGHSALTPQPGILPAAAAAATGLLLTGHALLRARLHHDRTAAVALGLPALPHLLIAGTALAAPDPGHGPGRLQLLLGCLCALTAATALTLLTPGGAAPFTAATLLAAGGILATALTTLTGLSATDTAALLAPAAPSLLAFLPGLAARSARLPLGHTPGAGGVETPAPPAPVDTAALATRTRCAHRTLLGLTAGCCAVGLGCALLLGPAPGPWPPLLALATGLALLGRARLFRPGPARLCCLATGLAALAPPVLGLARDPAPAPATLAVGAALALAAALLFTTATARPTEHPGPARARLLDLAEAAVLLSLAPLALAVLDAYAAVRSLTG
ncbi:type VII secretion integral membrane protein EccD [Streptomyces sp. NPDC097619]|uniref:type VII secretion integral membrane protein EccD n=1 Tax=Streptomyces sp. NPDC097619 TaxID=3157228 RepID=UPI00332177D8